jgi:hypothetical protein
VSGPDAKITQVAFIVRDLESTMRTYHERFGWGPWAIYELCAPLLHDTEAGGVAATSEMVAAIAPAGDIDIELFCPLNGPLADYLEQRGEGFHHIQCRSASGQDHELESRLRNSCDEPPLLDGLIGDALSFSYLDFSADLKTVVETLAGAVESAGEPARIWPA